MRDLLTMQERLESLFGRATPGWVPPVDLAEFDDRYVLTVELPGLTREDVHLDFADGTLTVRGQRPGQGCCPERYQQLERGQGQFSRSFRFAHPVARRRHHRRPGRRRPDGRRAQEPRAGPRRVSVD